MYSLRYKLNELPAADKTAAWTTHLLGPAWAKAGGETGTRYVFVSGILSQTRGAGTPPPLVILQSKVKFLKTISTVDDEPTETSVALVDNSLSKVLRDLAQESFTGLATKARVTVATSATWENTRDTGGTSESIREVLSLYHVDNPVPIRNLDTGEIDDYKGPLQFDTIGEFIFWACLDNVLNTPPEELRYAFLTVVREPGKGRSVTKGRACAKIVLDVVAKICAWPLKKGIKSSTSGMGQSHHAWNSFLDMMSTEMKSELFSLKEREERQFGDYVERTDTFEHLFQSSTDYQEATDRMQHWFAASAGNAWMVKCGIPPILRGITNAVCFQPRWIYFTATGVLSGMGEDASSLGENVRRMKLLKGVLMGDPLTKVVLHLSNVVARDIGANVHDADYLRDFGNAFTASEAYLKGLLERKVP